MPAKSDIKIDQRYLFNKKMVSHMDKKQYFKELKEQCKSLGWKLISKEYINSKTKLQFKCPSGHLVEKTPSSFKASPSCSECKGLIKRFLKLIKEKEYLLFNEPILNTKAKVVCPNKHIWNVFPIKFIEGKECPECKIPESKGEVAVRNFLTDMKVTFYSQYRISELPKRKFDFLFLCNGVLHVLEFDGEQHFKYTPHFHSSKESFKESQKIDRVKTVIALKAGYRVIRIDYTQSDFIKEHMLEALRSKEILYLSTPQKEINLLIYIKDK